MVHCAAFTQTGEKADVTMAWFMAHLLQIHPWAGKAAKAKKGQNGILEIGDLCTQKRPLSLEVRPRCPDNSPPHFWTKQICPSM